MLIEGFGRYQKIDATLLQPQTPSDCKRFIAYNTALIARGLGRSYGDSALANTILDMGQLNHFLAFDKNTGIVSCAAGIAIYELLTVFVPQGWFLPVTPGTRHVSLGGMIASDVHGKNHHHDGTISEHVISIKLLLGTGEIVETSKSSYPELFHATCGGMGLTGVILSVTLQLKPIKSSNILQTTVPSTCLDEALEHFAQHSEATYSVAWIDCLARGKHLGRSILMLGEHASDGVLTYNTKKPLTVRIQAPDWLVNQYSIKYFNAFYYHKNRLRPAASAVSLPTFFYPLDKLNNWNLLYGNSGFIQHQFVLPKSGGDIGLKKILQRITESKRGSFLAVLKTFGEQNANLLSFPMAGYTLALDFKVTPGLLELLDEIDNMVLDFGGRIYLTKDARMSEKTFKLSYNRWQEFEEVREKYGAVGKFASQQSKRIGLQ
jgi:decaprenylphospho-beta-D-ribofuranose 2-oxidase